MQPHFLLFFGFEVSLKDTQSLEFDSLRLFFDFADHEYITDDT